MQHRHLGLLIALAVGCGDDATDTPATTTLTTTGPGGTTGAASPTGETGNTSVDAPTDTGASASISTGDTGPGETGTPPASSTSDTTGAVSGETGSTTAQTSAETSGETGAGTTSGSTGEPVCPEDTIVCEGDTAKICDGMGGFKGEEACAEACAPGLGCVLCVPGSTECEGADVLKCNATGDGFDLVDTCDGLQGITCDADIGLCVGACANLGPSYIGCDYYPTVLQQYEGYNDAPTHVFAVAVANTTAELAKVTVTRGPNQVAVADVQPGSVKVLELPWVNELTKGTGPSVLVADGAYRLRSDKPVTVYQYNPLKATTTNDASVLLPVNTWTGNYVVASWQYWNAFGGHPGFYAVVAAHDGTKVKLLPSATGGVVQAGGGVAANGVGEVMLGQGDVLEVMVANGGDLTGTIVEADKPVQVFGGHECSNVPINVSACDHLEESMFPTETLAKEYVIVPPVQVPNNALDKGQIVRVIASEAQTTLTFDPDQPVNKVLANAGDFVEIPTTTAKFVVSADKKILVSQYMVGQDGGYGNSDPAMLLAVNPQQWRKSYLFHAAPSWQANFVDILAPKDAAVQVDGVAVGGWQPIGATNYQVAHVKLSNNGDGNHTVSGDVGVGIGVYGVQNYGSYWYPGGLDLDVLPQ